MHPSRFLAGLIFTAAYASASAEPFITRDQNPLIAGFGLPGALPSRLPQAAQWQPGITLNWGSSAIDQANARERLTVDGETRELRFTLGRSFSNGFAVQLQLPYRYLGGGSLDSFIDSWHDIFSLPEGARPDQPKDRLRVAYQRDGVTLIDQRASSRGIGDISADIGYRLGASQNASALAWVSLKLPTGDEEDLAGSGAVDIAFSLAAQQRLNQYWSIFGQASATLLGDGDVLPGQQRDVVFSALAGVSARVWRGLEFKTQIDARTAVFDDSDLDYLGEAVTLSIGGAYRFAAGWVLDLGVSEDIAVDASPDLVLLFAVRRAFNQ